MKFEKLKHFTLTGLLLVIAIIGLLSVFALPAGADVYQPNFYRSDTNAFPLTLTNAQGAVISGKAITVRQKTGLSEFVRVVSTNATALSLTIGHDVTYDGANGTTTHPVSFTVPANFVGTNTYWTNYPASYLDNVRTIQPTYATNNTAGGIAGSNSVTATITWSYSNQ